MKTKPIYKCLFLLLFIFGCKANETNTILPNVAPKELIVTSEIIPSDWKALPCESALCTSNGSSYEQSFNPKNYEPGQFFEEVYRLENIKDAKEKFMVYREGEFNKEHLDESSTKFSSPEELSYISQIADEYYLACGRQFGLVCKMIARYKNYFVFMYFDMDDGQGYGLTYQEVEKILVGLDEQITRLLYP